MKRRLWLVLLLCCFCLPVWASKASKLSREANQAVQRLYEVQPETRSVLARAKGILVFPAIYKGGIGLGAEYGKGALLKGGKTVGYYRIISGSIGLQLGAQKRAQIIAFMEPSALQKFEDSDGWKVGVDGSVVIADLGASGKVDSETFNKPIIAFILGEKGLMYNVTLEGSKISRFRP
jgi:lipid-binding SYLF domain-containing protein